MDFADFGKFGSALCLSFRKINVLYCRSSAGPLKRSLVFLVFNLKRFIWGWFPIWVFRGSWKASFLSEGDTNKVAISGDSYTLSVTIWSWYNGLGRFKNKNRKCTIKGRNKIFTLLHRLVWIWYILLLTFNKLQLSFRPINTYHMNHVDMTIFSKPADDDFLMALLHRLHEKCWGRYSLTDPRTFPW